jgi:transmembrane sensor
MIDAMNDPRDRIDAEAADWVTRLGGAKLTRAERRAFDAWKTASPEHEAAFARASALWHGLDAGGAKKLARRRAAMSGAAGVAVVIALFMGGGGGWIEPERWLADQTTSTGEIRTVRLDDGSMAEMDSHTALTIRYSTTERRIVLVGGGAYFIVAPVGATEHRPFVVEAARGTATALGTQFMVARDENGVETTVAEHSVRVAARDRGGINRSVIVSEGRSVRYGSDGAMDIPQDVSVSVRTAWRHGQIVFDNETLSTVLSRLGRYRRGRIVLASRALADRRVSGVFSCTDIDGALTTIAHELGAKSLSLGGLATVLF